MRSVHELHLSDCAITSDGFNNLMNAVEGNANFPVLILKNGVPMRAPLYCRLERNYIKVEDIQDKIDTGTLATFKKNGEGTHGNAKMKILVSEHQAPAWFQQFQGPASRDVVRSKRQRTDSTPITPAPYSTPITPTQCPITPSPRAWFHCVVC